jgi:RNA polymerase sigma-70 factor (ECF subfamily)
MTQKEATKINTVMTAAYNDYHKVLNARAFFKINNHETGQDLVQNTFMKTWVYLVKGGKIDIMKAFLYHILNNLIVDEYRKHKTYSLDVLVEKGFEPSSNDFEKHLDFIDGKSALLLIQDLPKKYQAVMNMRYAQSLTLKEMSLITGQSKNTMAVQAHRGFEKLKSLYETDINNNYL